MSTKALIDSRSWPLISLDGASNAGAVGQTFDLMRAARFKTTAALQLTRRSAHLSRRAFGMKAL